MSQKSKKINHLFRSICTFLLFVTVIFTGFSSLLGQEKENRRIDFCEKIQDLSYDCRSVKTFSIKEKAGEYFVLVTYESDLRQDIFRILPEDLSYYDHILNDKRFIFKKDGLFYRGRYALGHESGKLIDGKSYARPVLLLERPRVEKVEEDRAFYDIFQPESETLVNLKFIPGHDYIIDREELELYTPVTKEDMTSLVSRVVELNFGYSRTKVLVLDVGKSRVAKNDIGGVDEVDSKTSILFIPLDNKLKDSDLSMNWYKENRVSMPIYSASIFAIDESGDQSSNGYAFLTQYDRFGAYCYAPYSYQDSEFIKYRYNFIYLLELFGTFSVNLRDQLAEKKYTQEELLREDIAQSYVTEIRKYFQKSITKTTYLGTEVETIPFMNSDKKYISWISINQPFSSESESRLCQHLFVE